MQRIVLTSAIILFLFGACTYGEWSGKNYRADSDVQIATIQAEAQMEQARAQIAVAETQKQAQIATATIWSSVAPIVVFLVGVAIVLAIYIKWRAKTLIAQQKTTQMFLLYQTKAAELGGQLEWQNGYPIVYMPNGTQKRLVVRHPPTR